MKNFKLNTSVFILLVFLLSAVSCINKDFDDVEVATYTVDFEANKFIGDLKAEYTGETLDLIEEDIIIKGTVIGNDESGNFYKTIIIQDSLEDGTQAGIEIQLNETGLHTKFPIGQLVYIKCKGLYLGNYEGVVKIGVDYEGDVGRIEEPLIDQYLFKSDGGLPIQPKVVSIASLDIDCENIIGDEPTYTVVYRSEYVNTLIKIENCEFNENELTRTYADISNQTTSEVAFTDIQGYQGLVRTSGYANFANNQVAQGSGDLIAIYNPYRTDKQFYIRNLEEVQMDMNRFSFYSFSDNLAGFTPHSIVGSQVWHNDYDCAVMSGYDGSNHNANEDWLISPSINLSESSTASLSFVSTLNYLVSWSNTKVLICNDYDGVSNPNDSGTWEELSGYTNPNGHDWNFVNSGDIDISAYAGDSDVHFAFKYLSTSSNGCTWEISSVILK